MTPDKKFTSYNHQDEIDENSDVEDQEVEDINGNYNFDSQDPSEVSHENTRKNILFQENIIHDDKGVVTLEEVREFEEESDRSHSHSSRNHMVRDD